MREWDLRRIGDGMLQVMHMAWAEPLYWMRVLCSRLYSTASVDGVIFYGVSGLSSRWLPRSQRRSVSRSHISRRTTSPVVSPWSTPAAAMRACHPAWQLERKWLRSGVGWE